ncbi:serine hydrolase domain-containing protein [Actinomadura opuntiae]|uniref:serine hydrolase domain-containing protein n=1 Tax=Actinomadura sp. OS1-43 TaxID=604315 RepID=UPI00255AFA4E|nr:serine hydrolase domain-containing protein [Actinomadura sp. OS1-43]MDL4816700.1 serine hydrolase domain-containing protein [Actinomadura sp. OS1-43]
MNRRSALGLMGAVPLAAGGWLRTTGTASADGPAGRELRPGGEFDRFIAQQAAEDRFSGTVLLANRGRTVLSRSYGIADKERSIRNRPGTVFALGSISKVFVGVAVAQLAEAGKIAYDGKLGAYLDGFPAEVADRVTVHQMLTHTSGMGDYHQENPEYPHLQDTWTSADQVMDGTMALIRKNGLHSTPGTAYLYSNSAFVVLGAIVAKVSGLSYYDYVRRHIFGKAGMTASDFYTRPQGLNDRRIARPYTTTSSGQREDVAGERDFLGLPDGGAFATAADLMRFTAALNGHRLLGRAYTELITTPKVPLGTLPPKGDKPAKTAFAGYGPDSTLVNGQRILGHNGGSQGVDTAWYTYPYSGWTTVILCNYDGQTSAPIASLLEKLILAQH